MIDYSRREKAKYNAKRIVEVTSLKLTKPLRKWLIHRRLNVNINGLEKKPRDSSFIEVFNHTTYGDGFVLGTYRENRVIHFLIQKEDPEKRLSSSRRIIYDFLIWVWGQIGVSVVVEKGKIKSGNKEAIKRSIDYLLTFDRDVIGVFPEGPTMNMREYIKTGKKPPLYRGAAYIALATKKPIVPVGVYVDVPEELRLALFERTRENRRIIKKHIKEHGKIDYRISIGDPIYVVDESGNSCKFVTGNPKNPLHTDKVYFESRKDLEEILINEAMDRCYRLAEPNNVEGKLTYSF